MFRPASQKYVRIIGVQNGSICFEERLDLTSCRANFKFISFHKWFRLLAFHHLEMRNNICFVLFRSFYSSLDSCSSWFATDSQISHLLSGSFDFLEFLMAFWLGQLYRLLSSFSIFIWESSRHTKYNRNNGRGFLGVLIAIVLLPSSLSYQSLVVTGQPF